MGACIAAVTWATWWSGASNGSARTPQPSSISSTSAAAPSMRGAPLTTSRMSARVGRQTTCHARAVRHRPTPVRCSRMPGTTSYAVDKGMHVQRDCHGRHVCHAHKVAERDSLATTATMPANGLDSTAHTKATRGVGTTRVREDGSALAATCRRHNHVALVVLEQPPQPEREQSQCHNNVPTTMLFPLPIRWLNPLPPPPSRFHWRAPPWWAGLAT